MIRKFKAEDLDRLVEITKKGCIEEESDIVSYFKDDNNKSIVYEDDQIKGFASCEIWDEETKIINVHLYVEPEERRKGIGTALYKGIEKYIQEIKPNIIGTDFIVNKEDISPFYKKLGFKKWFGCHEMIYKGTCEPELDVKFIPYEDKYYEQYKKCRQDCFYELRKENDMQPYRCEYGEGNREETLKKKDCIYILIDKEELIASVMIENGYLDHIIVSPAHQGKGYGRKTTQFAINKALSQGNNLIKLTVIEWNTKAINLYKSLGFEIAETTHVYRQFGEK